MEEISSKMILQSCICTPWNTLTTHSSDAGEAPCRPKNISEMTESQKIMHNLNTVLKYYSNSIQHNTSHHITPHHTHSHTKQKIIRNTKTLHNTAQYNKKITFMKQQQHKSTKFNLFNTQYSRRAHINIKHEASVPIFTQHLSDTCDTRGSITLVTTTQYNQQHISQFIESHDITHTADRREEERGERRGLTSIGMTEPQQLQPQPEEEGKTGGVCGARVCEIFAD